MPLSDMFLFIMEEHVTVVLHTSFLFAAVLSRHQYNSESNIKIEKDIYCLTVNMLDFPFDLVNVRLILTNTYVLLFSDFNSNK